MTEANTRALRQKLACRISQIRAEREQQRLFEKRKGNLCDHEWKTYRQVIQIDHGAEVIKDQVRQYCGPRAAYFVVRGCEKCKTKHYIDMKDL